MEVNARNICKFDESSPDCDDWFYDSIQRYKNLQMYDLQMIPYCLATFRENWLCLAGHRKSRTEVLCTDIPRKLFLSEEESGRCKSNDLEIATGQFYNGLVRDFQLIPGEELAVAGFFNREDLICVPVNPDVSNGQSESAVEDSLDIQLQQPHFTMNPSSPELVATKSSTEKISVIDILTRNEHSILMPPLLGDGEVIPVYLDPGTLALLNSSTGFVSSLDLRCEEPVHNLGCCANGTDFDISVSNQGQIAVISDIGEFKMFDCRNPNESVIKSSLNFKQGSSHDCHEAHPRRRRKIVFNEANHLSISGFNNFVSLFSVVKAEIEEIFVHEGHSYVEGLGEGLVTDHLWMPRIADNFLLSASDNGSLNCWQYQVLKNGCESEP